jgi:putative ABC transport system permease protein
MPPIAPSRAAPTSAARRSRNVLGLIAAVVGVVLVLSGLGGGSLQSVGLGALLTFVGVAMLAPMFARPVARIVGAPVAATRGAAGHIARQNAMRSARRTAATASALMIGTALMAGSLILSQSFTKSVDRTVSKGALADLVITTPSQLGFSPALADDARQVPGVAVVHSYRDGVFKIGNATKDVTGLAPDAIDLRGPYPSFDIQVSAGDVQDLTGETIAVSSDVATDRGWSIGDEIDVAFPTGASRLRIVALYDENTLVGDYIIGIDALDAHFAETSDFLLVASIEPGADLRSVQADLQRIVDAGYPGLDVQDCDEYIGDVKAQ